MTEVPGRRIAPRERRWAPDARGLLALAMVLVTAFLVVAVTSAGPGEVEAPAAAGSTSRPLSQYRMACPPSPGSVKVASAPVDGLGAAGSVAVDGSQVRITRGEVVTSPVAGSAPAGVLASGELAAGLVAAAGDDALPCVAPSSQWWFTGVGGSPGRHTSELTVTNVDDATAVVDVEVLGPDGPVPTDGTRGIAIAGGASRSLRIADIAPLLDDEAVRVTASQGRVVATMSDTTHQLVGGASKVARLPSQAEPARSLLLPALPVGTTSPELVLANPAELEALVEIRLVGRDGTFQPSGIGEIRVPPGGVQVVDLSPAASRKEATALRVAASSPLTALLRGTVSGDRTSSAPVAALGEPAAALLPGDGRGTLLLTAGPKAPVASVTSYDDQGAELATERVAVRVGTTKPVPLPKKAALVLVTPLRGVLYGGLAVSRPKAQGYVGLISVLTRLDIPRLTPLLP